MKFAHLADCHIGGWREWELKELSIKAFEKAMDACIGENVEFVIIAGDLFNTSLPSIDALKKTTSVLRKVRDAGIPVYIIPGSHDFSPSRKTMLDVLENAGLCVNVFRYENDKLEFTEHKNVKLTGMLGLSGGLERGKYEGLKNKKELESDNSFKIFLFHTLLNELKPKEWENVPSESLSLLPKNFDYYAGGHPHFVFQKSFPDHKLVAYPGPLFPNNFKELEELKFGGFYIVEKKDKLELKHVPVKIKDVEVLRFDADEKTPEELQKEIMDKLSSNIKGKIVTIRVEGVLKSGKTSDLNFKKIIENSDAYIVLKNTAKLKTKEFEEIISTEDSVEDVENKIIKEHLGKVKLEDFGISNDEEKLMNELVVNLSKEKNEGEKVIDFESRVVKDMLKIFKVEDAFSLV